jgi:hypothetical protein
MNMPGFTAESSLDWSGRRYRVSPGAVTRIEVVVPQLWSEVFECLMAQVIADGICVGGGIVSCLLAQRWKNGKCDFD